MMIEFSNAYAASTSDRTRDSQGSRHDLQNAKQGHLCMKEFRNSPENDRQFDKGIHNEFSVRHNFSKSNDSINTVAFIFLFLQAAMQSPFHSYLTFGHSSIHGFPKVTICAFVLWCC